MKPTGSFINHINTNIFCALVRQIKLLIKQKAAVEFDPEAVIYKFQWFSDLMIDK
jgi:hypothetical protein